MSRLSARVWGVVFAASIGCGDGPAPDRSPPGPRSGAAVAADAAPSGTAGTSDVPELEPQPWPPSDIDDPGLEARYAASVLARYRRLAGAFDAAYREHPEIPRGLLEAVSYSRSGFAETTPEASGAQAVEVLEHGPMGLRQGDDKSFRDVLGLVSELSGIGRETLRTDARANIAGYAAAFSKLRTKLGVRGAGIVDHVPVLRALSPHVDDPLGRDLEALYLHSVLSFLEKHGAEQGFPWPRSQFDYGAILGPRLERLVTASAITVLDGELVADPGQEPQPLALALEKVESEPLPFLPIDPLPIDPIDPPLPDPAKPPVNSVAPSFTGTGIFQVEQLLTATKGTWSGTAPIKFTYQWVRCNDDGSGCVVIPDVTGEVYKLSADDLDKKVRVEVTASNSAGKVTATSALSGKVGHGCGRACTYPQGILWRPGHPDRLSAKRPRACGAVSGVLIHHTAGSTFDTLLRTWAGSGDTAAHYLISPDGKIAQAYSELQIVSHALGGHNTANIGIEHINSGSEPYPPAQLRASAALVRGIACRYGIDPKATYRGIGTGAEAPYLLPACIRIKGHGHASPNPGGKWDPGPYWDWWGFYREVTGVDPWTMVSGVEEQTGCGGIITDRGGDSSGYSANQFYHIRIKAPQSRILVNFQEWNLRAGDWMYIYDGPDFRSPAMGPWWSNKLPHFPATERPGTLRSSGDTLSMYFVSDCADEGRGFRFIWHAIDASGMKRCCFDTTKKIPPRSSSISRLSAGSSLAAPATAGAAGAGGSSEANVEGCADGSDACEGVPCEVDCATWPTEERFPYCGDGICGTEEECSCPDCPCPEGTSCSTSESSSCATCLEDSNDACCEGLECGPDPCGTSVSCGACPSGEHCEGGYCMPDPVTPCCGTRNCGLDPCGTGISCGTCPPLPAGDEGIMRCADASEDGVEPGHCICTNVHVGEENRCKRYRACREEHRETCAPGYACNEATEWCEPDCSGDPCCGNPDPCCGSPDPCCGNPDPCCGSPDPCCGNPDPCCGSSDPCCGVACGPGYECQDGICSPQGCSCNCTGNGCDCSPGASPECCNSCCTTYCADTGYCGDGHCDYSAYEDFECCEDCGTCGGGGYCGDGSCDYFAFEDIDCCWDCGTCGGGGGGGDGDGDGCGGWDDWDWWDEQFEPECYLEQ